MSILTITHSTNSFIPNVILEIYSTFYKICGVRENGIIVTICLAIYYSVIYCCSMSLKVKPQVTPAERRFKRYVHSRNPLNKKNREEYSNRPEVKIRRAELNAKRRELCTLLLWMLKNECLYNVDGDVLSLLANRPVNSKKGIYYCLTSDKKLAMDKYSSDVELLSKPREKPTQQEDKEFKDLLKKFVEGDPEVMKMLRTKNVVTKQEDENFDQVAAQIRDNYVEDIMAILDSSEDSDND